MLKRIGTLVLLGTSALAFVVHCSEPVHECGKDINCADPEGLKGEVAPGPVNSVTGVDPNNPSTGPSGGGSTDGGTSTPSVCTPLANDGGCSVSFKDDILGKYFGADGMWGCAAAGCHGNPGATNPVMDLTDPATTYKNLYNASSGNGPYINPCSTDPTKSEITGNLTIGVTTFGSHMPLGSTSIPAAADLAKVITPWVACGAPFN